MTSVLCPSAEAIVVESLLAEVAGQVVVVGPQIDRPALAQGVQDERPNVEMFVVHGMGAGLDADANGLRVIPAAAEGGHLDVPPILIKR